MMGTVAGEPKPFVTNVSVQMSHDFSTIMQQVLKEAKAGRFATNGEAVRRRDQLLGNQADTMVDSGATVDSGVSTAPAEPAEQLAPTDADHDEDGQIPEGTPDVVDVW